MSEDCIFCKIASGLLPCSKVYEDEHVLSFLDIAPISLGHTLIIPKDHYERFEECPQDVAANLAKCIGKIAKAVLNIVDAQDYNLLNNNGSSAGQVVGHVHFHIIPRHRDDGLLGRWPASEMPKEKLEELASRIFQSIE